MIYQVLFLFVLLISLGCSGGNQAEQPLVVQTPQVSPALIETPKPLIVVEETSGLCQFYISDPETLTEEQQRHLADEYCISMCALPALIEFSAREGSSVKDADERLRLILRLYREIPEWVDRVSVHDEAGERLRKDISEIFSLGHLTALEDSLIQLLEFLLKNEERLADAAKILLSLSDLYLIQNREEDAKQLCLQIAEYIPRTILHERVELLEALANRLIHHEELDLIERLYRDLLDEHRADITENQRIGAYQDLGFILVLKKDFDEALQILRRTLSMQENAGSPSVKNLEAILHSLAIGYTERGSYVEAEDADRRLLSLQEQLYAQRPLLYLPTLSHLANVQRLQNKFAEAESLLQQTGEIERAVFCQGHPQRIASSISLAALNLSRAEGEKADTLLLQAKNYLEENKHAHLPDYASVLNLMAQRAMQKPDYLQAELYLVRATQVLKERFGLKDIQLARPLSLLGQVYTLQQNYDQAESMLMQTMEIAEANFGENHPLLAPYLDHLARVYVLQGRHRDASPLLFRALNINIQEFGMSHPSVAQSMNQLGHVLLALDDRAAANRYYTQALDIYERTYQGPHPNLAVSLNNYARLLHTQNQFDQAQPYYRRAMEMYGQIEGDYTAELAKIYKDYADLLVELNQGDEATDYMTRARELREKLPTPTPAPLPTPTPENYVPMSKGPRTEG